MLITPTYTENHHENNFILTYPALLSLKQRDCLSDINLQHGFYELSDLEGKWTFINFVYCLPTKSPENAEIRLPAFFQTVLTSKRLVNPNEIKVYVRPIELDTIQSN